jgi:hypothetical protein
VGVVADILTLITKNNWWSYTMAVGFIAALLASGGLLLPASATAQKRSAPFRARGRQQPQGISRP